MSEREGGREGGERNVGESKGRETWGGEAGQRWGGEGLEGERKMEDRESWGGVREV